MNDATHGPGPSPSRRPPPPFRHARVLETVPLGARAVRVTVSGPDLVGFDAPEPAASVRLLLASPGSDEVVVPHWRGNEFLLPGGARPVIRTLTPRRTEPGAGRLEVEVVVHGRGAASSWARRARPGMPVAVSGPGRGYVLDTEATDVVMAGDETAVPAMSQLLEVVPAACGVTVHVEVTAPEARRPLPSHPRATVTWSVRRPGAPPGAVLLDAVRDAVIGPGTRVWVAGEAAGVQRVRRHLFEERGLPRARAVVRGYWKQGRSADTDAR